MCEINIISNYKIKKIWAVLRFIKASKNEMYLSGHILFILFYLYLF